MKVLIAPDKFAGTLSAPEAARAIAEGWSRVAPADELTLMPMSDGGPGFVDALGRSDDGIVNLEAAQSVGLDRGLDPWNASSYELGVAIRDVLVRTDSPPRCVRVGLGGTRTIDGGAGLLAALGAQADVPLDRGPAGLRGIGQLDLTAARALMNGIELVAAADTDVPLLGLFGAAKNFGPQKGLADHELVEVDAILDGFVVAALGATPAERRLADQPGAGAAGGLGFALMLLDAEVQRGVDVVAEAVGLADACARHDLVITGEGAFDHTSRTGKVVFGVST
ncbi:MAG TPA: glycerate kinase, partial [Aeromicrobium sp.]|nr:glycerate kinase [Aeromicrobium sp.]